MYGSFLEGDEDALEILVELFGNSLTLYIDGYIHDVHEAEDLMIDLFAYLIAKDRESVRAASRPTYTKRQEILPFAARRSGGGIMRSVLKNCRVSRKAIFWWRRPCRRKNEEKFFTCAWADSARTTARLCILCISRA